MLFTTLPYALFFAAVFVGHWLLPPPLRRPWLLVASYVFYMQAIPQYAYLIGAMTLANYGFGLLLGTTVAWRRAILITAIGANLATLAFFKYAAFALDSIWPLVRHVDHTPEPVVAIFLPLGISFFTFEFIHYVVEVYRGQPPIRHPIDFALFAAFFPTQIAGPIKRFPDWVKQLRQPTRLRDVRADEGLSLIVRGMAKKIIIADTLSPLVAVAFAHPERLSFVTAWCAIYAFAAQIYADFSGYTDIGRGCALLLGYSVPENFAAPYAARSPSEFWDRWHISLSRWLRDYLYIPLGGSRRPLPRVCMNLLITMALGGLWHGAAWHFMLWGGYQGLLLVGQRLWEARKAPDVARAGQQHRWQVLFGQIATFHLVCVGWVLFRAATPEALGNVLLAAGTPWRAGAAGVALVQPSALGLPALVLAACAALVVWGWLREAFTPRSVQSDMAPAAPLSAATNPHLALAARPIAIIALLVLVCIWPQGAAQRFIYFQF